MEFEVNPTFPVPSTALVKEDAKGTGEQTGSTEQF